MSKTIPVDHYPHSGFFIARIWKTGRALRGNQYTQPVPYPLFTPVPPSCSSLHCSSSPYQSRKSPRNLCWDVTAPVLTAELGRGCGGGPPGPPPHPPSPAAWPPIEIEHRGCFSPTACPVASLMAMVGLRPALNRIERAVADDAVDGGHRWLFPGASCLGGTGSLRIAMDLHPRQAQPHPQKPENLHEATDQDKSGLRRFPTEREGTMRWPRQLFARRVLWLLPDSQRMPAPSRWPG